MEIKMDFDFYRLQDCCWSGAIDTLKTIYDNDMEDEFMDFLANVAFEGEVPTLTEVNDLLWFEDEWIFDALGIREDDEGEDDDA